MDLDEWELLSDDEFLEIHDDGGRTICGSNYPIDFITNNYFVPPSQKLSDPIPPANQIRDVLRPEPTEEMGGDHVHDHDHGDTIVVNSHVSFKKMMRENEFVDMKMDSPENESSSSRIGGELEDDERSDGGRRLKIWKWDSTGIGTICSFGVAAATFCFIVFANVNGNHLKKKKKKNRGEKMNRKHLCFQIYGDDKVWT